MRKLIQSVGLSILLAVGIAGAQELSPSVSEDLRSRFLQSDFHPITKQSELPEILVTNFPGFGAGDIADAGEPYNYSDYIDENLPSRQIVLAGRGNGIMFLVLNQGGIATYRYTIVVAEESGVVLLCSYFFPPPPIIDLEDLRAKFEAERYAAESHCGSAV